MPYPVRILTLALLAGAALSGCGDNLPGDGHSSPDEWGDVGEYDRPGDFSRAGCQTGGFAGVEVEGIYQLAIDLDGYVSAEALRIDRRDDGGWGGVVVRQDATQVWVSDDDVLVRFADDEGELRAVDLCRRDDDGTVHGTYVRCRPDNADCFTGPLTGMPLEPLDEAPADGLTLVGQLSPWSVGFTTVGISINVRVDGDLAYLARYQDGLRIIDVSDPTAPRELAHLPVEFGDGEIWNDVKLITGPGGKRYALMASSVAGVVVVDVTTPTDPEIVGHFGTEFRVGEPLRIHTIFVDGGRAYIANSDYGLEIWDLADPLAPMRLGTFARPQGVGFTYLHDLFVAGDRAYLNFWDRGMSIVDVSDPARPSLIGTFDDYGGHTSHSSWVTQIGDRTIAVHGDEELGGHVNIVDVTEDSDAFASSIATFQTRPEVSVHNVMASGSLALIAYYQDGVRLLDLSDPTTPVEIGHYQNWPGYGPTYGYSFFEGALGIDWDLERGLVYVADSHQGLLVLRLPDER